jgi:superfamily II DNA or RNA helicase/HKD family nuclease
MNNSIKKDISNSIYTGLIDETGVSLEKYRPKLLINNADVGQKVLTSIVNELNACDEFYFSVAFITYSGIITLINTLKELEDKNIKGKIVASKYLNFTEPKALKKLLEFKNIELRMAENDNLHAKGYIFKKDDHYNMIVGSSNMTQNALSVNKEWNIKISSTDKGTLIGETLREFENTFESGIKVTDFWIKQYKEIYDNNKRHNSQREIAQETDAAESTASYAIAELIPQILPNKMQIEALKGIDQVREKGEKKALLISATGTGKTYLACFDVAKTKPQRVLFLAHREQILNQSVESFKNVLGHHIEVGMVGGGQKDFNKRFVFSTIQTLSKQHVLEKIPTNFYDYIVIDESHRSGAESYQRIINHFEPNFLLGMTATPERTDDYNICKDFNYNIAYEIRLEQAMKENMLCPFHYFGITELKIEGLEIAKDTEFRYLVSDERVRHIIEKINLYGYHGEVVKGLVFCSRNDEALELSNAFNEIGYKTIALSGKNTQEERENAIRRLEDESSYNHLDYIFTVDIFNEGVDIPQVNQVIMLRPTQSTIVFVQQLGRGLRKLRDKDFVVVLDFIGNYENNFMIPMALSNDKSFNKDTIRRFVAEGNRMFPGCSTVNFDKISKQKIYESIDNVKFSQIKFIKESYINLKYRLGRIPKPMDFEEHGSMDIARIFENKQILSYHNFLTKYESEYKIKFDETQTKFVEFISTKLAVGKRPHELLVIDALLKEENDPMRYMENKLKFEFQIEVKGKTKVNVVSVLTNNFATGISKNTYKMCVFLKEIRGVHTSSDLFKQKLKNEDFKEAVKELVDLGLYRNKKYYGNPYEKTSLQLYQKYSYEDVCRLLEWEKGEVALNIGGYKYDEKSKTYPVFINYHKEDEISESIKYEDRFLSNTRLIAISKSKRTVDSNDVVTAYAAEEKNITIELFVRKNKDDKGSKEFYYLGRMNTTGQPHPIKMGENGPDAVELTYHLHTPIRDDLYEYITEVSIE